MTRRSFVNWTRLTENDNLESGKEYMVCTVLSDNRGCLNFAEYHHEGDIIQLDLKDKAQDQNLTAKEKLLNAIWGGRRYEIPESGFYLITSDGMDEEGDEAFEGCAQRAVQVGNARPDGTPFACPCYWAELPIEPEGIHFYGTGLDWHLPEKERRKAEALSLEIDKDAVLTKAYREICGGISPVSGGRVHVTIGACVYSLSPAALGERMKNILTFARRAAAIPDEEFLAFSGSLDKTDVKKWPERILSFMKSHDIPRECSGYMYPYMDILEENIPGFSYHRDRLLDEAEKETLNIPAVMQEAWCQTGFLASLARLVHLVRSENPESLVAKELVLCTKYDSARKDSRRIESVIPEEFCRLYGINPDGSRYDGPSRFEETTEESDEKLDELNKEC